VIVVLLGYYWSIVSCEVITYLSINRNLQVEKRCQESKNHGQPWLLNSLFILLRLQKQSLTIN